MRDAVIRLVGFAPVQKSSKAELYVVVHPPRYNTDAVKLGTKHFISTGEGFLDSRLWPITDETEANGKLN